MGTGCSKIRNCTLAAVATANSPFLSVLNRWLYQQLVNDDDPHLLSIFISIA